ncbi:hypothetical protein [Hyalangium rubrum]|uniref:Uncharacterized protein n=1 Tax=Hyalangium rubrum TaxID=3103134 RepID=A0ABU5H0F9_9BACT|nr:hypothetical protein [Hyalangium sp. s54d21]MDY7226614.1 hypothetical protein [Hyalangium sp. s54d21]
MLAIHEHATLEAASSDLLDFILLPDNWLSIEQQAEDPALRPAQNALYQRRVGTLRVCASVEVSPTLEVFLRIAFRAPGLTPVKAADQLETFLRTRLPLTPNSEWQVEVDERRWIHFVRRYAGAHLRA